jgi:hypothetical protein
MSTLIVDENNCTGERVVEVKIDDLGIDVMFCTGDERGVSKVITEIGVEKSDSEMLPVISEEVKHIDAIGEPGEKVCPIGQVCKLTVGVVG